MDIPGQKQISVYAGRGILSESCGPVWMIGTGAPPFLSHLHSSYFYFLLGGTDSLYVYPSFHFFSDLVLILDKAEHHVLYQYRLVNAANHYMGLIQTETVRHNFIRVASLFDLIDFFL